MSPRPQVMARSKPAPAPAPAAAAAGSQRGAGRARGGRDSHNPTTIARAGLGDGGSARSSGAASAGGAAMFGWPRGAPRSALPLVSFALLSRLSFSLSLDTAVVAVLLPRSIGGLDGPRRHPHRDSSSVRNYSGPLDSTSLSLKILSCQKCDITRLLVSDTVSGKLRRPCPRSCGSVVPARTVARFCAGVAPLFSVETRQQQQRQHQPPPTKTNPHNASSSTTRW